MRLTMYGNTLTIESVRFPLKESNYTQTIRTMTTQHFDNICLYAVSDDRKKIGKMVGQLITDGLHPTIRYEPIVRSLAIYLDEEEAINHGLLDVPDILE